MWWRRLLASVQRILAPQMIGVSAGVEASQGLAVPQYPTMNSMSALGAFPWVRAGVRAIYTDLSMLPLRVVRREPGAGLGGGQMLEGHPALDLLRSPNPRCSERRLRRQLYLDFTLPGNAYLWRPTAGDLGGLLVRIHPDLVDPEVSGLGLVNAYRVDGIPQPIPWEQMLHIADASWSNDISAVLGEGAIRSLHDDLSAEKSAKELAQVQARRGRLEFILTAKDADGGFGDEEAQKIATRFDARRQLGNTAIVIGEALDATQLSLTPRDMEFAAMRQGTIDATLAVLGVPPVRVGLPSANYGTSKQQMRVYWENLQGVAALFDDELSRLTGDPNIRIMHDFSGVEALQPSRTERQMRAATWVFSFGADPRAAAAFEGFDDAPIPAGAPAQPSADLPADLKPPQRPQPEPDEGQERSAVAERLLAYLLGAAVRYQQRLEQTTETTGQAVRSQEAVLLCGLLLEHLPAADAMMWAERIASINDEAVHQHLQAVEQERAAALPLQQLAAFHPDQAAQLSAVISATHEAHP